VTFLPSPGTIRSFYVPGGPGIRVDTAAHQACRISPYYDSLVAKIIAHGRDREEAIQRMQRALDFSVIEGIRTTVPLHQRIMRDAGFHRGELSTRYLEDLLRSEAERAKEAETMEPA